MILLNNTLIISIENTLKLNTKLKETEMKPLFLHFLMENPSCMLILYLQDTLQIYVGGTHNIMNKQSTLKKTSFYTLLVCMFKESLFKNTKQWAILMTKWQIKMMKENFNIFCSLTETLLSLQLSIKISDTHIVIHLLLLL